MMKDTQGRSISHPFEALPKSDIIPMMLAFQAYLKQSTPRQIVDADPKSAVGSILRNYNRLRNLLHGCHVEYNLEHLPMAVGGTGSARDAFGGYTGA